jgi:small conductance mechanosensitive channel
MVINTVIALMQRVDESQHVRPDADQVLSSIFSMPLTIGLVLGILGYFGIQTTSFAALIAGAGLGDRRRLSGLLGNFAAGAFMLVLRLFKVGDSVTVGGRLTAPCASSGCSARRFVTERPRADDHRRTARSSPTRSRTSRRCRCDRVDRQAQLPGGVDTVDAIARLRQAVSAIPNVSTAPPPAITLLDLNLLGPIIAVRPYTHTDHYSQVFADTNEAIHAGRPGGGLAGADATQITRVATDLRAAPAAGSLCRRQRSDVGDVGVELLARVFRRDEGAERAGLAGQASTSRPRPGRCVAAEVAFVLLTGAMAGWRLNRRARSSGRRR